MDNALYVGLSRQMTLRRELDIVANNIANADTTGFKAESLMLEAAPRAPARTFGGPQPIKFVLDSGVARVKRYSHRNKVEQLQVEPISRAAANQRAGRCGRVSAGVCFRLFDEEDFNKRLPYTEPEILRSSLAGVILRMKSLHLGDV
ncbi:MAG TPA: flagellar basal body protein, partial [Phenylobacterium sp.]|nr:flagellar basal body protein [Phenylobacterium sp.]